MDRIHELFNELHKSLCDATHHERNLALLPIRVAVDAAHHDYTELVGYSNAPHHDRHNWQEINS